MFSATTPMAVVMGSVLLDVQNPEWYKHPDLLIDLDLANPSKCVIGKLYGGFNEGLEEIGLSEGCDHGFCCPHSVGLSSWDELTEAWKKEITLRLLKDCEFEPSHDVSAEHASV